MMAFWLLGANEKCATTETIRETCKTLDDGKDGPPDQIRNQAGLTPGDKIPLGFLDDSGKNQTHWQNVDQ